MLANELIDRLERLGLLDQEIIEALREQLEQGGTRVTPEAVAKLLVDNGQLTHFQATKLIGELRSDEYGDALPVAGDLTDGMDDLAVVAEEVDAVGVEVVDDVFAAEPVAVEAVAVEPVAVEAVAAEAVAVEAADGAGTPANRPAPRRKKPDPQKSIWDSFKIYGYIGIIVMLVLAGGFFAFVLNRENADEVIGEANKLYDQQNYQGAQDIYLSFLDSFPDSQYVSMAKVKITMTELYKAAQFKQEPWQATDLAREKLPMIAEEDGMNEERGNLAALMVDIAKNLATSAGRAKETSRKQTLLEKLDEHRELMNNPLYLPPSMKSTLAGPILEVEEARARVRRDISRNIRLDETERDMKMALEKKETKEAYDIRQQLLREFPELHDHERLVEQIVFASEIQQTLVKPSTEIPEVSEGIQESKKTQSILLTNLTGKPAPDLQGETLYLRAGGSVLAFEGETGKLKWRNFVGYAKDLPPVRMENGSGVLLSESASLEVLRCQVDDGTVTWRTKIGEPFSQPISVRDDIYVSTESGRITALDADSGEANWVTQIPQPLETGPGVDSRLKRAYLPGNHSNLYLLNTRDGSCLESFYIGHEDGTISVPPVPLLGHVFVIENQGADYSNVHVLRVDEKGEEIRNAQPLFRLTGNVRVPPIIQGRRLIVLTDRGEVVVFDIEPTAERDQVTIAATLPAFYDQPTSTQMAVGRSQMWITGTRIGRYELQINTGNVVRGWSLYELDTFIGQPFVSGDSLVHARVLRGTSAIRVTAANPKTGEEIWRTDVGVPISMIRKAPSGRGFQVVTSQAAMFELDREALASGSTKGPVENPGKAAIAIRFQDPISVDETRAVLLDQVNGQSFVMYDPNRETEQLRQVTINVVDGKPTSGGIAAGGGLFLPMDSGRAVLIDTITGAMKASPFQPPSDPTGKVDWTNPVALPNDPNQVVLADSRKKIYRVRIAEQLRELASKDLEYELSGTTAGVGDTLMGTTPGPAGDFVVGIEMSSLNEKFKHLLDARVIWGPKAVGDTAMLMTDDSKLRAFSSDGSETFSVDIDNGVPVGSPMMVGDKIVIAGAAGWLIAVDRNSGEVTGQTDLGEPLSATPFAVGNRLLVPGKEGVIYITEVPTN